MDELRPIPITSPKASDINAKVLPVGQAFNVPQVTNANNPTKSPANINASLDSSIATSAIKKAKPHLDRENYVQGHFKRFFEHLETREVIQ